MKIFYHVAVGLFLALALVLGLSVGHGLSAQTEEGPFYGDEVVDLTESVLKDKETIEQIQAESLNVEYLSRGEAKSKEMIKEQLPAPVEPAKQKTTMAFGEEALWGMLDGQEKKKITLDFDNIKLEEALRVIGEGSALNIVIDPAIKDNKITMHVKDVTIPEALKLIFQSYELSFSKTGSSIFVSTKNKIGSMALINKVIRLKNIAATKAEKLVKDLAQSVSADCGINALVVTGTVAQVAEVERIISEIDVSRRQVLLVTQVLELSRDALRELGVDWSDDLLVLSQESRRSTTVPETITDPKDWFRLYRFDRTPLQVEMTIKMLIEQNKAKILSNPKIATVSGEEASIFIGDRVPYEVTKVTGGTATTEVEFAEAGIRLKILPSIIEEDYVVVSVKPEVSFIYGWRGNGDQYPWIRTREASASVKVRNGEPFVVGGLLSEEEKKNIYKVPLLGDIPFLGSIFKYEKTTTDNKEIVITVVPQIMPE